MRNPLSKKIVSVQPSGIRKFFDVANEMEDVISLGVGEPDFDTPWRIREEGIFSLEKGRTFTLDDQIEIAHRLSREIEHSDPNLEALEHMMLEESVFSLQELLSGILGTTRQPEKK